MAENKKTIVVYADWIEQFESLSNEEAGKLIKHFFRYVNDLNPVPEDRITEIAFLPIKATLKRDLEKWERSSPQRIEKARVAGLASAEARRLKNELNSTNSTNELVLVEKSTQSTVSVSDSVNVNKPTTITYSIEKAIEICLRDLEWIDATSENCNLDKDKFQYALNDFKKNCISIGRNEDRTLFEFKSHFVNWVKIKKTLKAKETLKDRL